MLLKKIGFNEGDSIIFAEDIKFDNNKFLSLKKISVKTKKNKKKKQRFFYFIR